MIKTLIPSDFGPRSPGSFGEFATALIGRTGGVGSDSQRFVDITVYEGNSYFLLANDNVVGGRAYSCLNFEDAIIARKKIIPANLSVMIMSHSSSNYIDQIERLRSFLAEDINKDYTSVLAKMGIEEL